MCVYVLDLGPHVIHSFKGMFSSSDMLCTTRTIPRGTYSRYDPRSIENVSRKIIRLVRRKSDELTRWFDLAVSFAENPEGREAELGDDVFTNRRMR